MDGEVEIARGEQRPPFDRSAALAEDLANRLPNPSIAAMKPKIGCESSDADVMPLLASRIMRSDAWSMRKPPATIAAIPAGTERTCAPAGMPTTWLFMSL